MTKGVNTTSLDPAEEFPILYHLLTTPVVLAPELRPPSRGLKHKFSMLDFDFDGPVTKVTRFEADSSVALEDTSSYGSQKKLNHGCHCKYSRTRTVSEKIEEEEEEDKAVDDEEDMFPSSTTIDDEDLVDELVRKRKKSHRKNLPKQL